MNSLFDENIRYTYEQCSYITNWIDDTQKYFMWPLFYGYHYFLDVLNMINHILVFKIRNAANIDIR